MQERKATVKRNTKETQVELSVDLDGTGKAEFDTGISDRLFSLRELQRR